jgi:hypothetical protein
MVESKTKNKNPKNEVIGMKNEKKLYVSLPKPMHEQIWKTSGKYKVNLIAQCLMIEYLLDPKLQKKVTKRIRDGFKRNK